MWKEKENRERCRKKLNGRWALGKREREKERERKTKKYEYMHRMITKWTNKLQTYKGTNTKLQVRKNIGMNFSWIDVFKPQSKSLEHRFV